MPDFVESILMTFQMSLGEVMDVWNCLERSWHSVIGKLHWFMFVMVSCDWWTAGHVTETLLTSDWCRWSTCCC